MAKRTIIIFSIFISVAMITSAFIFLYRGATDKLINKYISKITVCSEITEEDLCFSRDYCVGIYKPSCLECKDLVFSNCERISFGTVAKIEKERGLCESSSGRWYRNKLGNFCFCQAGDKFDKKVGCVTKQL